MSVGIKTATGDVKIHSVRVVPADGYYTTRQIVEALEQYSDTNTTNVPLQTIYKTDGTFAKYIRCNTFVSQYLNGYSFNDKATKVHCRIYGSSTVTIRNCTGIYPTSTGSFGSFISTPGAYEKIKYNPNKLGYKHPAIAKKYPGIFSGQWTDFEDSEFNFTDLAVLANATTDDYIVVHKSGSIYSIYRYVGESAPVFEIASGSNYKAMNSQKDFRHGISSYLVSSSGKQLSAVVTIGSTENTDSFNIENIVAATFDIKDANDTVLFAKNADITDYVLPTT